MSSLGTPFCAFLFTRARMLLVVFGRNFRLHGTKPYSEFFYNNRREDNRIFFSSAK
jgi:hypothetical protein